MLDKGIFRQYDIRGVVPDNFNRDIAKLIGNGIGRRIIKQGQKRITCCYSGKRYQTFF